MERAPKSGASCEFALVGEQVFLRADLNAHRQQCWDGITSKTARGQMPDHVLHYRVCQIESW